MITLFGTIASGMNAAHRAIKEQWTRLLEYFPDLSEYHVGTINVHLDTPIRITRFDVSTPLIKWHPLEAEDEFSFLRVGFQLCASNFENPVDAVIYHAARSPHRGDPYFLEIMTRKLDLGGASRCCIHIRKERVELLVTAAKL